MYTYLVIKKNDVVNYYCFLIFSCCKNFSPIVRIFPMLWEFFSCYQNLFSCCENFSLVVRIFLQFRELFLVVRTFRLLQKFFSCFENFSPVLRIFRCVNFASVVRFFFLLWEFSSVARVLSTVMIIFLWWTKVTL